MAMQAKPAVDNSLNELSLKPAGDCIFDQKKMPMSCTNSKQFATSYTTSKFNHTPGALNGNLLSSLSHPSPLSLSYLSPCVLCLPFDYLFRATKAGAEALFGGLCTGQRTQKKGGFPCEKTFFSFALFRKTQNTHKKCTAIKFEKDKVVFEITTPAKDEKDNQDPAKEYTATFA